MSKWNNPTKYEWFFLQIHNNLITMLPLTSSHYMEKVINLLFRQIGKTLEYWNLISFTK